MAKEYFPQIGKIKFEGTESRNPLAFRYYDADRVVMGKKMSEWLKFAMAWWHTLGADGADQFGPGTKSFPWNADSDPIQAAKDKAEETISAHKMEKEIRREKIAAKIDHKKEISELRKTVEAEAEAIKAGN